MAEDSKFIPIQQRKYANVNSRIYQGWKRQQERKKRDFINFYPQDVPKDESDALIRFYKSGNGDNWTDNTGWLTDPVVGNWAGITVSGGHVIEINFAGDDNIKADIKYLKLLTKLLILDFANCDNVIGDISAVENMYDIINIEVDNTQIFGSLIHLNNKTNLREIKLDNLNITGDVSNLELGINMQTFRLANTLATGNANIISNFPILSGVGEFNGFHLEGSNVSTYTPTSIPNYDNLGIYIYNLSLSQTEIDNFLVDMDNSGSTNCPIDISGNSAPSQIGLDAIASLEGKGCTITYDTP